MYLASCSSTAVLFESNLVKMGDLVVVIVIHPKSVLLSNFLFQRNQINFILLNISKMLNNVSLINLKQTKNLFIIQANAGPQLNISELYLVYFGMGKREGTKSSLPKCRKKRSFVPSPLK